MQHHAPVNRAAQRLGRAASIYRGKSKYTEPGHKQKTGPLYSRRRLHKGPILSCLSSIPECAQSAFQIPEEVCFASGFRPKGRTLSVVDTTTSFLTSSLPPSWQLSRSSLPSWPCGPLLENWVSVRAHTSIDVHNIETISQIQK